MRPALILFDSLGAGGGGGIAKTAEQAGGILPLAKSMVLFPKGYFGCSQGEKLLGGRWSEG